MKITFKFLKLTLCYVVEKFPNTSKSVTPVEVTVDRYHKPFCRVKGGGRLMMFFSMTGSTLLLEVSSSFVNQPFPSGGWGSGLRVVV